MTYGPPRTIPFAAPQNNRAQVVEASNKGKGSTCASSFPKGFNLIFRAITKRKAVKNRYNPMFVKMRNMIDDADKTEKAPA